MLLNFAVIARRSTPPLQMTSLFIFRGQILFFAKWNAYSAAAITVFSLEKSLLAEVNAE